MKIFSICKDYHLKIGMALVGIDGVIVNSEKSLQRELDKALHDNTIGILIIEKSLENYEKPNVKDDNYKIIITI